ncbi:uncharacterized protein LOC128734626 [Sabethes cyaneus]|uniref:uncharacterized protein LOC128734626 n=1 Tax=Sabethes cyaneus TaxID=53552 RepID=UPI00237E3375|nr:uncharacterized protein LOC128734626 [Sabethes cyaneus]XP_053684896.1 uncharacterized protein LOC128734626 [Sabethes cyaneus]
MGGVPDENEESPAENSLYIYVGNLQKSATEDQLRDFFHECKGIQTVEFRLENCGYCPTKIAFVKFAHRDDAVKALRLNQSFFQSKRVFVTKVDSDRNFTPRYSVMVKQLNEYITEDDIYEHFRNIGAIECVQKPARNYAYISFERSEMAQRALKMMDRHLKGVEVEITPIKRSICMLLEKPKKFQFTSIASKCQGFGLRYDEKAETEVKLLVTNIPRQVPEKDIVDYLEKFGKIVDWEMQKSPISVLTNVGYVTYMNSNSARDVFLYGPHYFQGVALDIYNPRITYGERKSTTAVLLKRTNIFLTNDEIFQAMNECGRVAYIHRVDAVRLCTVVRFQFYIAVNQALSVKRIAQENVYVTKYTDESYLSDIAPLAETFPKSSMRIYKENELRKMMEVENRAEMLKLRTEPNPLYLNPNPEFYKNEVQILNYPDGIGLPQLREYFKKCGNVINFREVTQGFVRIGYLSFDTRLGARRACLMNKNFINGKRLLIHMANENLLIDPELCVNVTGINPAIADEDIYDQFNEIGMVKFVLRKSAERAVVCMEFKGWLEASLQIRSIGVHKIVVTLMNATFRGPSVQQFEVQQILNKKSAANQGPPLVQESRLNLRNVPLTSFGMNPIKTPTTPTDRTKTGFNVSLTSPSESKKNSNNPNGRVMSNSGSDTTMRSSNEHMSPSGLNGPLRVPGPSSMMGPNGPIENFDYSPMRGAPGSMMGPQGPMMGPQGPMMGPQGPMMGPQGPMMGPQGPMMGPQGPMMGPRGPMMGPQGPMMGPPGPMMGPQGPMMGPQGPMMGPQGPIMGPQGPMMGPNGPQSMPFVTPAMKRLMQIVEGNMISIQAFASLPMAEQFHLVHGIINQFQEVPYFIHMSLDKKINYLISGQNGFRCANLFTLFTYPQQLRLLNIIQTDFVNTSRAQANPTGPPTQDQPPVSQQTVQEELETSGSLAPWQLKSSRTWTNSDDPAFPSSSLSAQDRFEKAEKFRSSEATAGTNRAEYQKSRSMSVSPIMVRSRSNSPFKRDSLSPFSSALLSSPLLHYNRSSSKSPSRLRHRTRARQQSRSRSPNVSYRSRLTSPSSRRDRVYTRSPSRSPEFIRARSFRSRSPEWRPSRKSSSLSPRRSKNRSPLWDEDKQRSPTWDDEILREKKQESCASRDENDASSRIYVDNLPLETNEEDVADVFSQFGQIVTINLTLAHGQKRAFIKFDTLDQAIRALEMHLKLYRGQLLRVAFQNKKPKERPGFAISVAAKEPYDEIAMYETFKMYGEITNIWTRYHNDKAYCVIDFKHRDAVPAALDAEKLITGNSCKARAIV